MEHKKKKIDIIQIKQEPSGGLILPKNVMYYFMWCVAAIWAEVHGLVIVQNVTSDDGPPAIRMSSGWVTGLDWQESCATGVLDLRGSEEWCGWNG